MPRKVPWEFAPLGEDYSPTSILVLETSDVYVLWRLGISGPMSLGDFLESKQDKTFPNPEKIPFTRDELKSQFVGNLFAIDRTSLLDTLKRLTKKEMIISINSSKRSKMYSLTNIGFIWYFYHFWGQDAFKLFYRNYCTLKNTGHNLKVKFAKVKALENILPFLKDWENLTQETPNALQVFEKAISHIHWYNEVEVLTQFTETYRRNHDPPCI